MQFELEIVNTNLHKKLLLQIVDKKISNFVKKMMSDRNMFVEKLNKHIDKSSVVKFIRSDDGRGQLGIPDVDNVLSGLYTAMVESSFVVETSVNRNDAGRVIKFSIGDKEHLARLTHFVWTNSKDEFRDVNIFDLIETGEISGTGYENFTVDGYKYVEGGNLDYSRTGLGTMEKSGGDSSYTLPERFVQGFTRAAKSDRVVKLLLTFMTSRFRRA